MTKKQASTGDPETAAALRKLLNEMGEPSQRKVSKEAGLGDTFVWYIVTEQRGITVQSARKLAAYISEKVNRPLVQVYLELSGLARTGTIEAAPVAPVDPAESPILQAIAEAKGSTVEAEVVALTKPAEETIPKNETTDEAAALIAALAEDGLEGWVWAGVGVNKGKTFVTAQATKTTVQKVSSLGWSTFYKYARPLEKSDLAALKAAVAVKKGIATFDPESGTFEQIV